MKKISILGDSISTFTGYTTPDGVFYDLFCVAMAEMRGVDDTWWMRVIHELDGQLEVNNSFSSTTVCENFSCGNPIAESARIMDAFHRSPNYLPGCSDQRTAGLGNPDMILVSMGTNDAGYGVDLGKFSRDYHLMLQKLKRNYPHAEIWCSTLLWSYCIKNDCMDYYPPGASASLDPYNKVIREAAASEKCFLADLAAEGVEYAAIDIVHPHNEGMKTIADLWLKYLKTN